MLASLPDLTIEALVHRRLQLSRGDAASLSLADVRNANRRYCGCIFLNPYNMFISMMALFVR